MERSRTIARKKLIADWQTLNRIFIQPEDDASRRALIKYMQQILFGLHDFLQKHVGITEEMSLKALSDRFTDTGISLHPEKKLADVISDLVNEIAPHAVNVASPYFIGHMTSAIPYFMVHLKTIAAAVSPAAQPVHSPYPPPSMTISSRSSAMHLPAVGPWG